MPGHDGYMHVKAQRLQHSSKRSGCVRTVCATIGNALADTDRIDKIERMAKASWKSFDNVAFACDDSGGIQTLGWDAGEGLPVGYSPTVREAIDAAKESA
jgi:hypothetical protein